MVSRVDRERALSLLVPIIPFPRVLAWPDKDGKQEGARCPYVELVDALTREYKTDAHTTAYSVPHIERRLRDDALPKLTDGVPMRLFLADVDCPEAHKAAGGSSGLAAGEEWWLAEIDKVKELAVEHSAPFVFRTRGGYRILYRLPEPFVIKTAADGERWTQTYLRWIAYLGRRFGIVADPGCKDWQRLYRLPHATRDDGGKPENRETIGDPSAIGAWACNPSSEDIAASEALGKKKPERRILPGLAPSSYSGEGLFFHLLKAKGDIGALVDPGKWTIRCPLESEHSKGQTFDSSTVLFAPGYGHELGWINCKHSTRGHDRYTSRDWLRCFGESEIESARAAAGIEKHVARPRTYEEEERYALSDDDQSESGPDAAEAQARRPSKYDPERVVLSWVLAKPALIDLARARLTADDFTTPAHRALWSSMCELTDGRAEIGVAAVVGWLEDRRRLHEIGDTRERAISALEDFCAQAPADDRRLDPFIERVLDRSRMRRMGTAARAIVASAVSYAGDVQAFADRAVSVFRDIADRRDMLTVSHVSDVLREKFRLWSLMTTGRTAHGIETGFTDLDRILGGWRQEKLYVLAARPGVGKSALGLNTATHVSANGGGVAFFSMEMSADELTDRQLSAMSGVMLDRVSNPALQTDADRGAITTHAGFLTSHPLWIDDAAHLSLSDVRAKSKRIDSDIKRAGGAGLALIVVDYVGLMQEGSRGYRSREQAVAENARGLKLLSKEMKVPVLLLAQMNREIEQRGGRPRLSDLRESGSIEQDADVVLFLYRSMKKEDGTEANRGPTELIVAKHRGGRTGTINLFFKSEITRFMPCDVKHEESPRYGDN